VPQKVVSACARRVRFSHCKWKKQSLCVCQPPVDACRVHG
jgi:hypothetical protein